MIPNNTKTSVLVPFQLPDFIQEDPSYKNFTLFIQAYYEWMEQTNNVTDVAKNLLTYRDIDSLYAANVASSGTNDLVDQFIGYFKNEFLPNFPQEILANPVEVIKLARQLYQSKGTPSSYKFLFRVLYDTDVDFFNTSDAVLKASAGTWYVPQSLSLLSDDTNFLSDSVAGLRIFGETSQTIATIQTTVQSNIKTEVFISDIERLFNSGEYCRVVDGKNQDVYFLNGKIVSSTTAGAEVLRAKLVGQISGVTIWGAATGRGENYEPGDPVIIYGGLNKDIPSPHGANAYVSTVTSGSITGITVNYGGFGYTPDQSNLGQTEETTPYTYLKIINGNKATAIVGEVDTANTSYTSNVNLLTQDCIDYRLNYYIGNFHSTIANVSDSNGPKIYNPTTNEWSNGTYQFANNLTSNANTSLANAFTFISPFQTYPISTVYVTNGGGGISLASQLSIETDSFYTTELVGQVSGHDAKGGNIYFPPGNLGNLGILAPIQIANTGKNYIVGNQIQIIGGSGYGAYANVSNVSVTGGIIGVSYVNDPFTPHRYPLGGMGYRINALPTCNVVSSTGANASLYVPGILGQGAQFTISTDRVGSVTTINVDDYGLDYETKPNTSLRVQDIVVSNLTLINLPAQGDVVYQGANINVATYVATVNSIPILVPNALQQQSLFNMRVFNYSSTPANNTPIKVVSKNISMNIANTYVPIEPDPRYKAGIVIYGDGNAKANTKFLNGLTIGNGQYITTAGQPSSFDVLQSIDFNNFTYEITLEKEIARYRNTLLNLLHPTGLKVLGRYAIKSNGDMNIGVTQDIRQGNTLDYLTNNVSTNLSMIASFSNPSNNIIQFNNLAGTNLANIIIANTSTIDILTNQAGYIHSLITSVNYTSNTVTLRDNVWIAIANVAYVSGNSGACTINIQALTGSYDIVNNGQYSNTTYPLIDIVHINDTLQLVDGPNTFNRTVSTVDYIDGVITLTSNLSYTFTNAVMSVNKTLTANASNVSIYHTIE